MPWNSQSLDPSAGKLRTPENGTTSALPAPDPTRKKPVSGAMMPPDHRLLVDRRNAAQYLSISKRSLDYLLANGELSIRRIGSGF